MNFTSPLILKMGGRGTARLAKRFLMLKSMQKVAKNISDENCCASKRQPKEMRNLFLSICYSILALIVVNLIPLSWSSTTCEARRSETLLI